MIKTIIMYFLSFLPIFFMIFIALVPNMEFKNKVSIVLSMLFLTSISLTAISKYKKINILSVFLFIILNLRFVYEHFDKTSAHAIPTKDIFIIFTIYYGTIYLLKYMIVLQSLNEKENSVN